MLNLYFGFLKEAKSPSIFDKIYKPSWIESDFARIAIVEVDKCKVINGDTIESSVLGIIPPTKLSGACKTLLIIRFSDTIVSLDTLSADCFRYLREVCNTKDVITCASNYYRLLFDSRFNNIRILNTNKIITNSTEMYFEYLRCIEKAYDSEGKKIKVSLEEVYANISE